jgi:hypothetical protein
MEYIIQVGQIGLTLLCPEQQKGDKHYVDSAAEERDSSKKMRSGPPARAIFFRIGV